MSNLEIVASSIFEKPLSELTQEQVHAESVIDLFFAAINNSPNLNLGIKLEAALIARLLETGQQSPEDLAGNLENLWNQVGSEFTLRPIVDTETLQLTGFSLNPIHYCQTVV